MTTTHPAITPFEISIPDADIADLRERLARTRLPNVPGGADVKGYPVEAVRALLTQWQDFDWHAAQERLNQLPQFVIDVDGIPIHVVYARAAQPSDKLPVVLLHGWADSFFGQTALVEPLTAAGHDVIVPSVPGYAFSGQPTSTLGGDQAAELIGKALAQLEVTRYAVAGGDWGGYLAEQLALTAPDRVAAIHLLNVPFWHMFMLDLDDATDAAERDLLEARERFPEKGWGATDGYVGIQSSQPLTLAYGLSDSPVGLLAWLAEKYAAWTDREPDVETVLTQVSLYWFSNTIFSSMRVYAEGMEWGEGDDWDAGEGDDGDWSANEGESGEWAAPICEVPAGFAIFPADIYQSPRTFAQRFFSDIRRFSSMPAGGHFAAMDEPDALAHEIVAFLDEVS